MGGEFADFAENKKGSLEATMFTDLIAWHDNPFTAVLTNILDLNINLIMVDGKVVHQA